MLNNELSCSNCFKFSSFDFIWINGFMSSFYKNKPYLHNQYNSVEKPRRYVEQWMVNKLHCKFDLFWLSGFRGEDFQIFFFGQSQFNLQIFIKNRYNTLCSRTTHNNVLLIVQIKLLFKFYLVEKCSFLGSVFVFYTYVLFIAITAMLDDWWDHRKQFWNKIA